MIKVSEVRDVPVPLSVKIKAAIYGALAALGLLVVVCALSGKPLDSLGTLALWGLPIFGAVSNTAVAAIGQNLRTCDITATADADATTGNIAHGCGFTPDYVEITPILAPGGLKAWAWDRANTDGTNIVFLGNNVVGSGNAGAQLRVVFGRRHTMIR